MKPSGQVPADKLERYKKKFEKCTLCVNILNDFDGFVTEERWNETFDQRLEPWLDAEASANMRIFMGMPKAADLVVKGKKGSKTT